RRGALAWMFTRESGAANRERRQHGQVVGGEAVVPAVGEDAVLLDLDDWRDENVVDDIAFASDAAEPVHGGRRWPVMPFAARLHPIHERREGVRDGVVRENPVRNRGGPRVEVSGHHQWQLRRVNGRESLANESRALLSRAFTDVVEVRVQMNVRASGG